MNTIGSTVVYSQLYQFRQEQSKILQNNEYIDSLTPVQCGMIELEKCHHISTTTPNKNSPPSYRVRVCKTCCQNDNHIELGTYVDQESAILVNDTHEILNGRFDKLLVLLPDDKPYLHLLNAVKYDRQRGRDHTNILTLLNDRLNQGDERKRRKRHYDGINSVSSNSSYSEATVDDSTSKSSDGNDSPNDDKKGFTSGTTDVATDTSNDTSNELSPPPSNKCDTIELAYLLLNKMVPNVTRPRSNTFSVSSPMSTLTRLATMKDEEITAAKFLSELGIDSNDKINSNKYIDNDINELSIPLFQSLNAAALELEGSYELENFTSSNTSISADDSKRKLSKHIKIEKVKNLKSNMLRPRSNSLPHIKYKDDDDIHKQIDNSNIQPYTRKRSNTNGFEINDINFIGVYSPEERKKRIERFLEKRTRRVWTKKVKYDVRKNFADSRIRVKGRFVRKEDEETLKTTDLLNDEIYRPRSRSNSFIANKITNITIDNKLQRGQSYDNNNRIDSNNDDGDNDEDDDEDD